MAKSKAGTETEPIRVPLDALKPDPRNPRQMSDAARAGLGVSLETFGELGMVFNDRTGQWVSGHQRAERLRAAGATEVVRTGPEGYIVHPATGERFRVRFVDWDETKQRMANLVANNPHIGGDFTEDALAQLKELEDVEGFAELELGKLEKELAEELDLEEDEAKGGECDPDEVPDDVEPLSKRGDLWLLGDHRLMCGDSTSAEDVARLLGQEKPHLMVTDPPYGVEYDPAWRDEAAKHSPSMGNRKDTATGKVTNDHECDWTKAWKLFQGDVAYVWHAGLHATRVLSSLEDAGFKARAQIIWAKSHLVIGRGDYHYQHEPCWYVVRRGKTGHYNGDRTQTTLWEIEKPQKSETGHGTQKPTERMSRPIVNNSNRGEAVYEPFSGSGTTIIAAEQLGRRCYAMELEPKYVDVAVARWEKFTGRKAVRADAG